MTSAGELRRRSLEALSRPSYSVNDGSMLLLNDNSNLFGVNPAALQVAEKFDFSRLWAYPSENSDSLRARLAEEYGVSPEEVIVGNGSDELLDITVKTFIDPGEVMCSPAPTFSMYKFYARVNMARVVERPLRDDFSLDAQSIIEEAPKLSMICQPNNPTSRLFDLDAIREVLSGSPGIVLIDEAYADFCGSNMLPEVMASERAIDLRTCSKAIGLAGLRAGFAIARREVIDELRRVRTPFGLNTFTEAVVIGAMDNSSWVREKVSEMVREREYLAGKLSDMGFKVYPSDSNYLLCRCPVDGPGLVKSLRSRGVVVRDCNSFTMLRDHIRVTIGPRPMLDRFIASLGGLLPEATT
jgi:histidinol-phosphate aminotransferase